MGKKIVIIDYQLGNLFSVNQALVNIGLSTIITSNANDIKEADAIILPGVGAFADAMNNLNTMHITQEIKAFVTTGKPFLGICLGLQLLFSNSEEFGNTTGLNLVEGIVKRFSNEVINGSMLKVPQIAWNSIQKPKNKNWENTPFQNLKNGEDMYFVHSYYVLPTNENVVLSKTTYGNTEYASSIMKDNIFACQFHPEKSAKEGLQIYKNWAQQNCLV